MWGSVTSEMATLKRPGFELTWDKDGRKSRVHSVDCPDDPGWVFVLFEFWTSYEQSVSWERKPPKHPLETVDGSRGILWLWQGQPLFLAEAFELACQGLWEVTPRGHGLQPWLAHTNNNSWAIHFGFFPFSAFLLDLRSVRARSRSRSLKLLMLFLLSTFQYFIHFLLMNLSYFSSWKKKLGLKAKWKVSVRTIPEALAIYTWGTETVKGEGVTDPGHTATLCKAWNRTQVSLLCLPHQAASWFRSKITWK